MMTTLFLTYGHYCVIQTALLDLYHIGDLERRFVTPDNVFSCFLAACFLELIGLAQFCTTLIQKQMCDMQNLLDLVHKLGQIKPLVEASDEPNHQYVPHFLNSPDINTHLTYILKIALQIL